MRAPAWTSALLALALLGGARGAVSDSLPASAADDKAVVTEARAALAAKDPQKAADIVQQFLLRSVGSAELEDVFGQALLLLGRKDEAAHHFGAALRLFPETDPARKQVVTRLSAADAKYTRRANVMQQASKELFEVCQKLNAAGHTERALQMLERLEPIASGAEKQSIAALAAKIRAAKQEVELDQGSSDDSRAKELPQVRVEGKHYVIDANLEQSVAERVRDVMDDIYGYYVQIYFDGDASRAAPTKPTIRIYPTHQEMMKHWDGPQSVGGWWSAGDQTVSCYDTRTDKRGPDGKGTLDEMLLTLFHEASHHFMWMLAKGGDVPSWINEGTASFFEGATAMEDRRVLWPDAARERLYFLKQQLDTGTGPTVAQVVSYNDPGSYPGEYYTFGWGLVYYLLQYEDPKTLEYVFRPLYAQYREKIAKTGAEPMALFKEVFLGPKSPGGFTEFEAWAARWKQWIREEIYPQHFGQPAKVRELRVAKAHAYVAAADRARTEKPCRVPEAELLSRALGHLEYVRSKIDGETVFDADLALLQADVLERMGRPQGTAALLEQILEAADKGDVALEPERYDQLEKRLAKLDVKNQPLRLAKQRSRGFAKTAAKLLDEYRASDVSMTLTAYEFARAMAVALDSEVLSQSADELRGKAHDAGLLAGALYKVAGPAASWVTIFEAPDETFEHDDARVSIGGTRPVGRLCTAVPLAGEYELRCTLKRVGEVKLTTSQGVIFSGTPNTPWFVACLDGKGKLALRRYVKGGSERGLTAPALDPPVGSEESTTFAVHVFPDNRIVVRVGERPPVEVELEEELPRSGFVGVYAKYGQVELSDLVVEVFP